MTDAHSENEAWDRESGWTMEGFLAGHRDEEEVASHPLFDDRDYQAKLRTIASEWLQEANDATETSDRRRGLLTWDERLADRMKFIDQVLKGEI